MKKTSKLITGISDSRSAKVIADRLIPQRQAFIVRAGRRQADRLAEDLAFFSDREIIVLPPEEELFLRYEAKNRDADRIRAKALSRLSRNPELVVIAPASAAVRRMPPRRASVGDRYPVLRVGEERDPAELRRILVDLGYEPEDLVSSPGRFAARGGILDIFPPEAPQPFRVEFFGDRLDSIRTFSPATQRSLQSIDTVTIGPGREILTTSIDANRAFARIKDSYGKRIGALETMLATAPADSSLTIRETLTRLEERRDNLLDKVRQNDPDIVSTYLPYFCDDTVTFPAYMTDPLLIFDDPARIKEHLDLRTKELRNDVETLAERGMAVEEEFDLMTGTQDLESLYRDRDVLFLAPFAATLSFLPPPNETIHIESQPMMSFAGHLELAAEEAKRLIKAGYDIILAASSEERKESLSDYFSRLNLSPLHLKQGNLSRGMVFSEEKIAYISDFDIFHSGKRTKRRHASADSRDLTDFTDLHKGDYVVHDNHGIGKFLGIEALALRGDCKDYIKIKYAGDDLLYVPVEQMDMVRKYIGSGGALPKINKLSGDEWKNAKKRAGKAVAEMTEELVRLYAERQSSESYAFSPDTVWQKEFEAAFPYQETEDQIRAAETIKKAMEKKEPMDILLCGDVGYGKTEVAARAAFKCLVEGKQVAFLVPTTLLAKQHYETLTERFQSYPFTIDMLSRFRTPKECAAIVDRIGKGKADLIIGTHRLLSADVHFADLGLLIIDEEQRFGVGAKEKIKGLKSSVDVLTLSATPIPRTLNMSLTGIRDICLLTEAPEGRYPVQTYVTEEDPILIREVINRELDRNGQVFVVYNRVRGIKRLAARIQELIPEARVVYGHGQMGEKTLEEVMNRFVDKEADILVSTTIVESGLDIPNANTMLIIDADKCGLAQLYQLRGRVGRSDRIAYCYLIYKKEKVLSEIAAKRLRTIKEFTELGAGFKIALRDLEIRGAGNILGAEQSGHMADIGYELYCKIVEEAVQKAKGLPLPEKPQETTIELEDRVNIPNSYISNESQKLEQYRNIAAIRTAEDEENVLDELIDRFGEPPVETRNLLHIARIRYLAGLCGFTRLFDREGKTYLEMNEEKPISPYAYMQAAAVFGPRLFFHGGRAPYLKLLSPKAKKLAEVVKLLQILYDNRDGGQGGSKML